MNAFRETGRRQIPVDDFGHERRDRGEEFGQRHQHGVKRLVRGQLVLALLALPETPPIATDVPIAEAVVDELLRVQAKRTDIEDLELTAGGLNQKLKIRQDPAVDVRTPGNRNL